MIAQQYRKQWHRRASRIDGSLTLMEENAEFEREYSFLG